MLWPQKRKWVFYRAEIEQKARKEANKPHWNRVLGMGRAQTESGTARRKSALHSKEIQTGSLEQSRGVQGWGAAPAPPCRRPLCLWEPFHDGEDPQGAESGSSEPAPLLHSPKHAHSRAPAHGLSQRTSLQTRSTPWRRCKTPPQWTHQQEDVKDLVKGSSHQPRPSVSASPLLKSKQATSNVTRQSSEFTPVFVGGQEYCGGKHHLLE